MPGLFETYTPSLLAIPAFHLLSILPHSLALYTASPSAIDNRNPRASLRAASLKERLTPAQFERVQRLEACHSNSMENLPIFMAAVLAGHVAGLPRGEMSTFAGAFLGLRVLYAFLYVGAKTQAVSVGRSLVWMGSVGLCWRVFIRAARELGKGVMRW